ncbi:MAG: hypothetical protein Sv326_0445 [Candidatus Fermentimicrarchaeum limneticum]|uniref:Uncharacterized protein n=1 Tax=Fermentimicrarchaeum limneticum TaxID=2795018 RepID=A0A7D6BF92_FERL1|nr:MAG: hypothetical protein Sv326_0371 [Candidatus Fermentimicrarchaeum limneticum]QLJ52583.1 MAG: hypothetical protein Sv326_0408 [Candidatus Fermentimicrarchaeum limneticum]QLJ52620.1 MAG: hypothetical protein Sv326_0445 [Candidatus Fermentimicrarchaeum limneticum]
MEGWKKYGIAAMCLVLLGVAAYVAVLPTAYQAGAVVADKVVYSEDGSVELASKSPDALQYTGVLCVGARLDGIYYDYGCRHNIITSKGRNMLAWSVEGNGTALVLNKLGVGNSSAGQVAADTDLANLYTNCGLSIATVTPYSPGVGNWSVNNVFTSTCTNIVANTTGIYNTTTAGNLFAEANYTSVTLNINDQLNLTYNMWVQ